MTQIKQGSAYNRMVNLGATGLTPTVTVSKNGGAFAAISGGMSEIANNWYSLALNSTDTNTLGDLVYNFSTGTPDAESQRDEITGVDPLDGVHFGLTSLPGFAASAAGGLLINGTNTDAKFQIGGLVTTVYGFDIQGSASGSGFSARVGGGGGLGNLGGLLLQAAGVGEGLKLQGSQSGAGVTIRAGGSSGNAIDVFTTSGFGINVAPSGSNMDAVRLVPTGTGLGVNGVLAALSDAGIAAFLDLANGVETGWTVRQLMRVLLAMAGGKVSIVGTTVKFRNQADSLDRITAVVDVAGQRLTVTFNLA